MAAFIAESVGPTWCVLAIGRLDTVWKYLLRG